MLLRNEMGTQTGERDQPGMTPVLGRGRHLCHHSFPVDHGLTHSYWKHKPFVRLTSCISGIAYPSRPLFQAHVVSWELWKKYQTRCPLIISSLDPVIFTWVAAPWYHYLNHLSVV